MAPASKRKSNYKSDHFVASDDEEDRPAKKGKSGGSDFKPSLEPQTDGSGDKYWEISKLRRVTISEFKGKSLINIREYYEKEGESLPGKKVRTPMSDWVPLVDVALGYQYDCRATLGFDHSSTAD